MQPRSARTTLARMLSVLGLVLTLSGCASAAARPAEADSAAAVGGRPALDALALLHRWDGRRAAAYSASDPHALRRLYSRGSWAATRDVRILRGYVERGLVVAQLRNQVLEVGRARRDGRVLRVRVVERLAGATVSSGGLVADLPGGRVRERVLTFVHLERGWVVRSVSAGRL